MAPAAEAHIRKAVVLRVRMEAVVAAAAAEPEGAVAVAGAHQREAHTAAEGRRPPDLECTPMQERDKRCSLVDRRHWGSSRRLGDQPESKPESRGEPGRRAEPAYKEVDCRSLQGW